MSMRIELKCEPTTLDEAALAEQVIQAVREIVVGQHGGYLYAPVYTHRLVRHPEETQWVDHGLTIMVGGHVTLDGAQIPPLREVRQGE